MKDATSSIKQLIYLLAKLTGAFWASKYITRNGLRILCYHGIWEGENKYFSDTLFMKPSTFDVRMRHLKKLGYPVLTLDEAFQRLRDNNLPPNAVVITIDDGFYSTYSSMLPALESCAFPATVYVTSYYSQKRVPITQLVLRYIINCTEKDILPLSWLDKELSGTLPLSNRHERETAAGYANSHLSALTCGEREAACEVLAVKLNVDFSSIKTERRLSLMTEEELQDMTDRGFDIQLHTHRHRISHNGNSVLEFELKDNRRFLEPIAKRPLKHFCYPSGIYSKNYWPELQRANVDTATTCRNGLNYRSTHPYELRRTLDAESVSALEFEAELSGFGEIIRNLRTRITGTKA